MRSLTLTLTLTLIALVGYGQSKSDSTVTKLKNGHKLTVCHSPYIDSAIMQQARMGGYFGPAARVLNKIDSERLGNSFISTAQNNFTIQGSIPPASITITGSTGKDITLQFKKDGKDVGITPNWDLIVLKMKKSQVKWLNDSTAVFIRKP